ncbi:branched-chain amino acid ABC transporter substrate-binding protein [Frankia sp. R43]|uniref:ABC transporter substrate-binding protein n=1 Tax=Frankia sp. R43 TaxID=269536 RepID=UPI0006CA0050|nr:ABC transporter substrate-binding protein [Frankia sp. R43]KPM50789.1 branched-chain amino acid ABC transporter substrate-binding protein [Frankia sp. R43]
MNPIPALARRLAVPLAAICLAAACTNSGGGTDGQTGPPPAPPGTVPGVTSGEIRFAVLATGSNNPIGTCIMECLTQGIEDYFAFRNSTGGAHGRKLVVTTRVDDQLGKNKEGALQIISANDTFATFGAAQLPTGWDDLYKAGIPQYVWAIQSEAMNGKDSIFGNIAPTCLDCTIRSFAYVAEKKKATRIAALGYNVPGAPKKCVGTITDTIRLYSGETGQQIVYSNDNMTYGLPNGVGPEVSAMRAAGVDMVIGCFDLNGMKTLAQEMERQGLADVPMYHLNTYDHAFVAAAGDLFEGDVVTVLFRPFEATSKSGGIAEYLRWTSRGGHQPTEAGMNGWINADLAYQGLLAAGPNFDRKSVVAATNRMTDYDAGGLVNPIDWSRQHEWPTQDDPATHGYRQECYAFVEIRNGKFQIFGGTAEKPFVCWQNKDRSWSEPTPTSFG